jgi:hypothetical protein
MRIPDQNECGSGSTTQWSQHNLKQELDPEPPSLNKLSKYRYTSKYLDMVAAAVVGDLSQSGHMVSLEAMHELKKGKTCQKINHLHVYTK